MSAVVRQNETVRDDAGVPLCVECRMQEGEYHQGDCLLAYPPDLEERVSDLDLPVGRVCRCGDRMRVKDVDDSHDWPVVLWDCRCGRSFACQVKPETGEIVASEWQG